MDIKASANGYRIPSHNLNPQFLEAQHLAEFHYYPPLSVDLRPHCIQRFTRNLRSHRSAFEIDLSQEIVVALEDLQVYPSVYRSDMLFHPSKIYNSGKKTEGETSPSEPDISPAVVTRQICAKTQSLR